MQKKSKLISSENIYIYIYIYTYISNIAFYSIPKYEVRNFVVPLYEQYKTQQHKTPLQTTVTW